MNFIDKIIKLCTVSTDKIDTKKEYYHKATILNFYSIVSLLLLIIFSVIQIFQNNILYFSILLTLSFLILINTILLRKNGNFLFTSNVFTVLFSALLIWLLYSGKINDQGIIFYSFYPVLVLLLLGKKRGNIFSTGLFILVAIYILIPALLPLKIEFEIANQIGQR